jgi:ABC-type uncharacterized transport system substrate-binding protein
MNFITKRLKDIKMNDILKGYCIELGSRHEYNYDMYKRKQFDKYDLSILKYNIYVPDIQQSNGFTTMRELKDNESKLSSGINLTPEYFTNLFRNYDKKNLYCGKLFKVISEEHSTNCGYGEEPETFIIRTAIELTEDLQIKQGGIKFSFYDDSFYNMAYGILDDVIHYSKLPNECIFKYRTKWINTFEVSEKIIE